MKENTAALFRSWGLPASWKGSKNALRYKNPLEKGIYWHYFSIHIRTRDVKRWGCCISCGRYMSSIVEGDCGHFIAASKCGIDLLFDPRNNNLECSQCNAWDETHLLGYERNLDIRYGAGTAQSLKDRFFAYKEGPTVKDWHRDIYIAKLNEIGIFQISTV